jgi:hypothetical protein
VSDDWKFRIVSKGNDTYVNRKSKNSHHGGTSVVQFNGTLLKRGLFIKVGPSVVDVSVTEGFGTSWNLTQPHATSRNLTQPHATSRNLTHEGAFEDTNEGDHLNNSGGGDVVASEDGSNSIGVRVEGVTSVVDGSWKVDSGTGGDLAREGQLTDASMLDLDVTKTFESLFGGIT